MVDVSDNVVIIIGISLLFTAFVLCLPLITWIIIGRGKEDETAEIYTYKGNRYILINKPTLNKNTETRMWDRVVFYANEDESLYFTREESDFYKKFKKEIKGEV